MGAQKERGLTSCLRGCSPRAGEPCGSAGIDKGGMRMDMWKFFNITHREHILCNPMSLEKLEQLITLLPLKPVLGVLATSSGLQP